MNTGTLAFSTVGVTLAAFILQAKMPTPKQWVLIVFYLFALAVVNDVQPKLAARFALLVFVVALMNGGYTIVKKVS